MPYGSRVPEHNLPSTVLVAVRFTSICPQCGVERSQRGNRAALLSLLNLGHPVEAYCEICDGYWPVSPRERAEIAKDIAA